MIMLTGNGWDGVGQLVMAISVVALLAYLAPATMRLDPQWRKRCQIAALALLGVALIVALGDAVLWFLR